MLDFINNQNAVGWSTAIGGTPSNFNAAQMGYRFYDFPEQSLNTLTTGSPWSMTRTGDADNNTKVVRGIFCAVNEGVTNNSKSFILTTPDPISLNTTPLSFSIF